MSLFRTSLRPPAILSDEAIERYVEAIRHELQPDPLYRRRLRGMVLNRYVAAREGAIASVRPRARAASACPGGTALIPERRASQTKAAV